MKLTTHVLDTSIGRPAPGVSIELYLVAGEARSPLATALTNFDGRTDRPIGNDLSPGTYELVFDVRDYFSASEKTTFFDKILVRFTLEANSATYHVPLLLSPWGYTTYRGS